MMTEQSRRLGLPLPLALPSPAVTLVPRSSHSSFIPLLYPRRVDITPTHNLWMSRHAMRRHIRHNVLPRLLHPLNAHLLKMTTFLTALWPVRSRALPTPRSARLWLTSSLVPRQVVILLRRASET